VPFRSPKIDEEWRTTIILAGIALLLSVMIVAEAVVRYF
jgi:hypothetical protein